MNWVAAGVMCFGVLTLLVAGYWFGRWEGEAKANRKHVNSKQEGYENGHQIGRIEGYEAGEAMGLSIGEGRGYSRGYLAGQRDSTQVNGLAGEA